MSVESFKVEVDGNEVEVIKKEDYDTAVSQLYKEMKEAKEERDRLIGMFPETKNNYLKTKKIL